MQVHYCVTCLMQRQLAQIKTLVRTLSDNIPFATQQAAAVSAAPIGWHIEHALLVVDSVINACCSSVPGAYQHKRSFVRFLIMTFEKIPRGKVKAPKGVRPGADISVAQLQEHVTRTMKNVDRLSGLTAGHFFSHPFLGDMRLRSTAKFIMIHTKHHLAIIRDIRRRQH
jgi:DinB superfamily